MNAKELLNKVKAIFEATPAEPTPAPAEPAPSVTVDLDGGSQLVVSPALEAGASATIGGQPAPAGEYKSLTGETIVIGEGGVVSEVKPAEPITPAEGEQTPAPAPVQLSEIKTAEELQAIFNGFAEGTPEERIARLEAICKATMEYCFGWQLREAEEKATREQAIAAYRTGMEEAQKEIATQKETIKGLFEVCEKLAETPTAEPQTLTGTKKEKFEKLNKREQRIATIGNAIAQLKKS